MSDNHAPTLLEHTTRQLRNLCQENGFASSDETPADMLRELLGVAGRRRLSEGPLWPSDVADDATPVEFSVALDDTGDRAVRVLGEVIAERPGMAANVVAARRFLDTMSDHLGIPKDRFDAVQDLFLPEEPQGKFAFWYSMIFRPDARPKLKVYFNPAVRGEDREAELVAEGFRRLGMDEAYDAATEYSVQRGAQDRFTFFAVDLDDSPTARVKLYISHYAATVEEAVRASQAVDGLDADSIRDFCRVLGGDTVTYEGRPLVSSYSFLDSDPKRPGNYSLYLPIRDYVADDVEARERVVSFLKGRGADPAGLDRAIRAVTDRPLADGRGLLAHVSLRLGRFGTGTTIYLSSEGYEVLPPQVGRAAEPAFVEA
ncbi:tryptophan dimethylallyltransferase family protein [Saccharomonospora xinjiangensis]|uniref:Tryptophan dimethylallyltransferase n=1 Tax=Saccharomonospora xinjiangensis XJ-54 TaxID=882086 RepID=I0V343_9PSEU|nr:tryptophan dimethylallyltransferase family protein [Saccharomonospora xinjiangensis]EID54546.1 Tryptophan dimethylallyltransferase [Saccharomonospora xinjiangensis XJ-54]